MNKFINKYGDVIEDVFMIICGAGSVIFGLTCIKYDWNKAKRSPE